MKDDDEYNEDAIDAGLKQQVEDLLNMQQQYFDVHKTYVCVSTT